MRNIAKNAVHLFLLTIIKLIVPIAIMPYLARVLSTEQYATYAYVRACMTFVTLLMDYGFIYTATREVAENGNDVNKNSNVIREVTRIKVCFFLIAIVLMGILAFVKETLQDYLIYILITTIGTCLLNIVPDYLFRGLEKLEFLSTRMFISRMITTALVFVLVKCENDFIMVAYLEVLCAVLVLGATVVWLKKQDYFLRVNNDFKEMSRRIKDGFSYFVATAAPSAYGALNTLFIGQFLPDLEIIYWSTSWNVITAVLHFYNPLINSIFPYAVKRGDKKILRKVLLYVMPIILFGTILIWLLSNRAFEFLVGNEYVQGAYSLKVLCPVLFVAFPGMVIGSLGFGIAKRDAELGKMTVLTAVFHVVGLVVLVISRRFTLLNVCFLRVGTECVGTFLRTIRYTKICTYTMNRESEG